MINRNNIFPSNRVSSISFIYLFFSFIFFQMISFNGSVFAQNNDDSQASQSVELEIASLEQSYDTQVSQMLSNHFDRKKFFVDVNIDAVIISESLGTTENQVVQSRRQNIFLPGLPYLPEENLKESEFLVDNPETIVSQNTYRTLKLNNLTISIYADSSFSDQEIEFMRLIAGIAAKTDASRGDVINISRLIMPDFSKPTIDTIIPIQEPVTPNGFLQSMNDYWPGIILALIFIVGLMGHSFLARSASPNNFNQNRTDLKKEMHFDGVLNTSPTGLPFTPSSKPVKKELSPKENEADILVSNFLNNSQETALLFEYWIDRDPTGGAEKAAKVVGAVDRNLIRSLKSEMSPEKYSSIIYALELLPEDSKEEKAEVIQNFNALLKPKEGVKSDSKKYIQLGLFKFLDHISDQHILQLLKSENPETAALIIDYLPEDKGAYLLRYVESKKATSIMLKLSTLHKLSYINQTEISSKLFDRVIELREIEKNERDGIDNILPVLERLPVSEQKDYIDRLKASGSSLGSLIEKQFITIDVIPKLTDEIILDAVEQINTATLMLALVDMNENIVNKILSVRPKREQKLIREELQQIEVEESELSKSILMKAIRNSAKQHGFYS